MNNQEVLFADGEKKSYLKLKEKEITLANNGSKIKLVEDIRLNCGKASALVSKDIIQLVFSDKGINISDGKINISGDIKKLIA